MYQKEQNELGSILGLATDFTSILPDQDQEMEN